MDGARAAGSGGTGAGSSLATVAFGTAVAMWGVAYFARLPALQLPAPWLLALLLACQLAGGLVLGRRAGQGFSRGALAGAGSGLINLLVLGSLLAGEGPGGIVPSAWIWLPGSIALCALLVGAGAWLGRRGSRPPPSADWTHLFVRVSIAGALLLLLVGGVVTSTGSGLAVVDWPNSFGYNMFLYPVSRMTGGIYYEHSHRLFGALVGLTTLVQALVLQRGERRGWVRALGWLAFGLVLGQGILGGLRVTGSFTLAAEAGSTRPSLPLALIHGIGAQLFLVLLVVLGAATSPTWKGPTPPLVRPSARADRLMVTGLLALLLAQLALGASQRHFGRLLFAHVTVGVALVAPLAIHAGFRFFGLNDGRPLLGRLGLVLVGAVAAQILLGFAAFAVTAAGTAGSPTALEVALTTSHQWFGAVLLALAATLACWTFRLVAPR